MPNLPISQLPVAAPLTGSELFAIVQNGTTKQTTFTQVASASYEENSYYGSFYHTASMNNTLENTAYSMSLSTTDLSNGVSIQGADKTQITIANPGIYNIQFSAQITKTSGTKSNVYIWLNQNGEDVPNSNSNITLDGGSGDALIAAWNFFFRTTSPNEYVKLMWGGTVSNVRILYAPASGIYPAIPSLIVTVNRVG